MEENKELGHQGHTDSKKTEKVLVIVAILLLLLSTGALYFDDWLWSGLRSREDVIGMITSRRGDVRLKFDQEVSWQKATRGQALQYNDSIFAGSDSEADLKLGETQLTVSQNSLVVLRREMDANFLNLNFGTLFGKVAKNEKVYIDTGSGKPTLLKTNSAAEIVLKKNGDKTSLEVVKGTAEIEVDGVKKALKENSELILPGKGQALSEKKLEIKVLPPSPMETIYSKSPQELKFKWSYGGEVGSNDRFEVEFSKDASFARSIKKTSYGSTETSMQVARSNQLHYRVKGPKGELSPTHRFSFVRMWTPQIILPEEEQVFKTPYRSPFNLSVKVKAGPLSPRLWSQVAADPEFKTVLVNESHVESEWTQRLPAGLYYMRVRSDYGDNNLSDWSLVRRFEIQEEQSKVRLPIATLEKEITIPNRSYPQHLYGGSDSEAQEHLWQNGFLRDHFFNLKDHYDQLSVDFGSGDIETVKDSSFPRKKIYPGSLSYRYQLQRGGQLPSQWSPKEKLNIRLEPPKQNFAEVVDSELKNDGLVPVRIDYTPVLFAKGYDFEVATNPSFLKSKSFKSSNPQQKLKLKLKEDYYYRVRALNAQGQPISSYSTPMKLSSNQLLNQVRLAQNKIKEQNREPAQENTAESRANLKQTLEFIPDDHNFWAWLGSGLSYVNYKQTISERGDLDSSSRNDKPGQYFEVGYVGDHGYGAVLGYKSTPGEVLVDNATLDESKYVWRTVSLEGLLLRRANFRIFGLPVNYGPRVGIQSHNVPYIFLNSLDQLELKQNDMITASAGLMGEAATGRWKIHSYMRYQLPVTASSGGAQSFDIKPKFAFDGLLGSSYYFSPNFKVGAFWYGQWHYYDFVYGDASITNSGTQSLFYSTMDLRVGFEF